MSTRASGTPRNAGGEHDHPGRRLVVRRVLDVLRVGRHRGRVVKRLAVVSVASLLVGVAAILELERRLVRRLSDAINGGKP